MNYAGLRTAVQDYCENTFSDTDFAIMTRLAEQTINNTAQLPSLRKSFTGAVTSGSQYLAAPDDFLASNSIAIVDGSGNYTFLLNKDPNFIRESYPNASVTGLPKYYAIYGPQVSSVVKIMFILGPTPDSAYATEVQYFAYPESIVTATNTWLGNNYETVLFNGVMVEAARIMKSEQDMVTLYDKRFTESLALLKNLGDGKNRQDQYRSGQVRDRVV